MALNISAVTSFNQRQWISGTNARVDGAFLCVMGKGGESKLILKSCTFKIVSNAGDSARGGAIFVSDLDLDVLSCHIEACESVTSGGGIYGKNLGSVLIGKSTKFLTNKCDGAGSAFYITFPETGGESGNLTLDDCTFTDCETRKPVSLGGLICINNYQEARMRTCTVTASSKTYNGMIVFQTPRQTEGNFEVYKCTITLTTCTVTEGWLRIQVPQILYTETHFTVTNQAQSHAGIFALPNQDQTVTISGCTFTTSSKVDGSAVDTQYMKSCTITGSTFTQCSSESTGYGGVVLARQGTWCSIDNCKFIKNSGKGEALALRILTERAKETIVKNCKFQEHSGSSPVLTFAAQGTQSRLLAGEMVNITNCNFTDNRVDAAGTLIKLSAPTSWGNCVFENNTANVIKGYGGTSTFNNCYFALFVNQARSVVPMIADDESSGTTFAFNDCSFVHYACDLKDDTGIYVTLKNTASKLTLNDKCCFDEHRNISIKCAGECGSFPEQVFRECQPWSEAPSVEMQCPTEPPAPIEPSESEVVPIQSSEERPHESGDAPENKGGDPNTAGIVAGVIIAILVIVAVVLILLWLFVWKRRHDKSSRASDEQELSEETTTTQSIEPTENFDTSAAYPLFGTEKLRIETFAANFEEMID